VLVNDKETFVLANQTHVMTAAFSFEVQQISMQLPLFDLALA